MFEKEVNIQLFQFFIGVDGISQNCYDTVILITEVDRVHALGK